MKLTKHYILLLTLTVASLTATAQKEWHNPMDSVVPYIGGRAWNSEIGNTSYQRMPDRLQPQISKKAWNLQRQSAGLTVRFTTNSKNITARYSLGGSSEGLRNMSPMEHSGLDLYAKTADGDWHWIGNHMQWKWKKGQKDSITISWEKITAPSYRNRGLEYVLYLPPYNSLRCLEIGVDKGSKFQFLYQSEERPIVVYGTSIIQGASPSRPGLMITNIVEREMQYPVITLGFSGAAFMEPGMFGALSEIDARAFVLDPIPNSYSLKPDTLTSRAKAGVRLLRAKTEAPILLMEGYVTANRMFRPDVEKKFRRADKALRRAYEELKAEGVKGLYYLPHDSLVMGEEYSIEGSHPNDLGCRKYADAYESALREVLKEDTPNKRYPPVTQRRDGCYEWMQRHNAVIELNHTTNPDVLLIGNSITHFFGGQPAMGVNNGGEAWQKTFGRHRVVNMGFGWDRIENVFWRIYHGELEGCTPKHIFLLIGINNYKDRPQDVAQGIADLATLIRQRQPKAKLHVIKVYPARGRDKFVNDTNRELEQRLKTDKMTELVDFGSKLLLPDGSGQINPDYFCKDGLHPNEAGYMVIGKQLKKHLK